MGETVIRSVNFVKSAAKGDQFPPAELPEIAMVGKSNVGKSSLINHLVRRKGLAHTSNTPGRTQLINFFEINGNLVLVDLPGYGYAKVPAAVREEWQPLIMSYLEHRATLKGILFLLDARRTPSKEEKALLKLFARRQTPLFFVITKIDKIAKNRRLQRYREIATALGLPHQVLLPYSVKDTDCREDLWQVILKLLPAA